MSTKTDELMRLVDQFQDAVAGHHAGRLSRDVKVQRYEALRSAIQDVVKDAERYRWLVENVITGSIGFGDWWINADEPPSEWDSSIDAAMKPEAP